MVIIDNVRRLSSTVLYYTNIYSFQSPKISSNGYLHAHRQFSSVLAKRLHEHMLEKIESENGTIITRYQAGGMTSLIDR